MRIPTDPLSTFAFYLYTPAVDENETKYNFTGTSNSNQ